MSALDNITSNDTVTGSITTVNPITSFEAQLDQSSAISVLSSISGTTFTITPAMLATINGGPVADGKHTLTLMADDSNGNLSQPVSVSFILLTDTACAGDAAATGLERHRHELERRNHAGTTPTFKVVAPANDDRHALRQRRAGRPGDGIQRSSIHRDDDAGRRNLSDDGDCGRRRRQRQRGGCAGNARHQHHAPDNADAGARRRISEPTRADDRDKLARS